MTYRLTLTAEDVATIAWVGGRYCWSDALRYLDAGEHELAEHEAWAIQEAIEADMEGGHDAFPLLDPRSELARKLAHLVEEIV